MGPLRRGLTGIALLASVARQIKSAPLAFAFALVAGPARAEVCNKERPNWDGVPVGMVQEALMLTLSPAALVLIAASMLAIRFKSQWGALIVVLLWTGLLSLLTMLDPTGVRALAQAEGCLGSPALFIGAVIALCAGMIVYTAPRLGKSQ